MQEARTPGLFHPLNKPIFRSLLIADLVSDLGTFMQTVGAGWLMVSLNAGPFYIALTQTASALPFFVFALPAGAIGDIVDRRRLILFTEIWMACVAMILTAATVGSFITPALLLVLTFALSMGDAFESPAWRALLPEMVSREDLASASALNGIEFNFARAIGPALAGFIIAAAGIGTAFAINAVSFAAVILVVARWKRSPGKRQAPLETFGGATKAAIRYVRYSPHVRLLAVRSGATMLFASGLLALLPSVARNISSSPADYGVLLGFFGAGAVLGALLIQRLRKKRSSEAIVSTGVLVFGLTECAAGLLRSFAPLCLAMLVGGAAWIVFISLFNVLFFNQAPDWVRARIVAVSLLVVQGAMAAGSAIWGGLALKTGIHAALMWAGVGTIASTSLGLFLKLPDSEVDLTPWGHWRLPAILIPESADADSGPVLVTVEYDVAPEHQHEFLKAIQKYERIRRRDGAYEWDVFRDTENPTRYLETFLVSSWGEHLRQHERMTRADHEAEQRVQSLIRGTPVVRHLIHPDGIL